VFYSICPSGLEEYYWRWFAFKRVSALPGLSFVPAALVANGAFMLHHIILLGVYFGYGNWLTWFSSFGVFVGGLVWQTIYRRTDSVYGGWLSHGLIDAGIFAVGFLMIP
ncbi:MAG: CPBP family intramembrane metalloprotease, partial [Thermoguttaceae bacterium]|nr:CPBP family intramembrane metalloprotease [Thermoguttaceae bacterium]